MDFITIIGLLDTLISFEEVGRSWLPILKNKSNKRKMKLSRWDSTDPVVQRLLDAFKSSAQAKYKEHIFSDEEKEMIAEGFFEKHKQFGIGYFEKRQLREYIIDILEKYNEYNRSLMSSGEKMIYDGMQSGFKKMREMLENNSQPVYKAEKTYAVPRFYSEIEECLVPTIGETHETYKDLANFVREKTACIQLVGLGGSGKTSFLRKFVSELEQENQKVLFLEVNRLEISLWDCIDLETEKLILVFDGINEVEFAQQEKILSDIEKIFAHSENVSVIISSRKEINGELSFVEFDKKSINPLDEEVIRQYVKEQRGSCDGIDNLMALLSSPMMLTVYCNNNYELIKSEDIVYFQFMKECTTSGALIHDYLESNVAKAYIDHGRDKMELWNALFVRHFILPEIAFLMEKANKIITEHKWLIENLKNIIRQIENKRECVKQWFLERNMDCPDKVSLLEEYNLLQYMREHQQVFVWDTKYWAFVHQNYRDELAAEKIVKDSQKAIKEIPTAFFDIMSSEVLAFAGDLLEQKSECLENLLDILRHRKADEIEIALKNLLEIIRNCRGNLAGLDFSNLDLRSQILYPHIDGRKGQIITKFDGAHVYPENFFPNGHGSRVTAVCFNQDGSLFATASDDGEVMITHTKSGIVKKRGKINQNNFCSGILFSSDDRYLLLAHFSRFVVFETESMKIVYEYEVKHGIIQQIVMNPIKAEAALVIQHYGVVIIHYENHEIQNEMIDQDEDEWSEGPVKAAITKDGAFALVGYESGKVILWQLRDNTIIYQNSFENTSVRDVKYSNKGDKFAVAYQSGKIYLVDIKKNYNISLCDGHTRFCFMVNFSPDDKRLVSASADTNVILWNVEDGSIFKKLENHQEYVQVAKYDKAGKYLISSDCEGVICIWDGKDGSLRNVLHEHEDIVGKMEFHPSEPVFLSASIDERVILWNVVSGKKIFTLNNREKRIFEYEFDNNWICTIDTPSEIARIWSKKNECVWEKRAGYHFFFVGSHYYCAWNRKEIAMYSIPDNHIIWRKECEDRIDSVKISNKRNYACIILSNKQFEVLNIQTGECVYSEQEACMNITFSPKDTYIFYRKKDVLYLCEIDTQSILASWSVDESRYYQAYYSKEEDVLYICDFHNILAAFDLIQFEECFLPEQGNKIIVSGRSELLAIISKDQKIYVGESFSTSVEVQFEIKNHFAISDDLYPQMMLINDWHHVRIISESNGKIRAEFTLPDHAWNVRFMGEDTVSYIDETKIIKFNFITNQQEVLLDQEYEAKLVGCKLQNAVMDETISEDQKTLLMQY